MDKALKVGVCDDEKHILEENVKIVEEVLKEKEAAYVIKAFESPRELLLSQMQFDIVILDIEMKGVSGIEVAKKLRTNDENCIVFFVTNHENYLDTAFDAHAFRFWLKPIDKARLSKAFDSAIARLEKRENFIVVTRGTSKIKIMQKSIVYVSSVMKKTIIVTPKGEIEVSDKFSDIMKKLSSNSDFFETHRGYCVNFAYVSDYDKTKVFCTVKDKKHEVYLSRRKYSIFCKSFIEWMGKE